MPIEYTVSEDGHFIHAVASEPVTHDEFIQYEIEHAIDQRIRPPVSELFEFEGDALKTVTMDDMHRILEKRNEIETPPLPHRCAMVLPFGDVHGWDLAKLYEGMVMVHSPESVIVFGDSSVARIWLGREPVEVKTNF